MPKKTIRDFKTVETKTTVYECDVERCYSTQDDSTIYELPFATSEDGERQKVYICNKCLETFFGIIEFDYSGSAKTEVETIEGVSRLEKLMWNETIIPFIAIFGFASLIITYYTPSWVGGVVLGIVAAIIFVGASKGLLEHQIIQEEYET